MELKKVIEQARAVKRRFGKGYVEQLLDIAHLRFKPPTYLGVTEYYDLKVFAQPSRTAMSTFGGFRLHAFVRRRVNNSTWTCFHRDKLLFHMLCTSLGLPVGEIVAAVTCEERNAGDIAVLSSKEAVYDLLRDVAYPIFVKPILGSHGAGVIGLAHLDEASDVITASDGAKMSRAEAAERLWQMAKARNQRGCIVQPFLTSHEKMRALAGSNPSGVRLAMCMDGTRPRAYRAILKVNVNERLTDHYYQGRVGNLLADVDVATGIITQAVSGYGPDIVEVSHHPVTSTRLTDFEIPYWPDLVVACEALAAALAGLPMIGIDVVVTPHGPVLLEVNTPGDFDLLQIPAARGVLAEPHVRALVNEAMGTVRP